MKKILLTLALISTTTLALAQTPARALPSEQAQPPVAADSKQAPLDSSPSGTQNVQMAPPYLKNRELMEKRAHLMWERMDANHDGKIDRAEFLALASAEFDRLDRDHKGYLVPDDLKAFALLHHKQGDNTVHPHPHVPAQPQNNQ